MTYFVKNFPILTSREDVHNETERLNNGKTVNLFEDWDQVRENKLITLEAIGDAIAWIKMFIVEELYLEDIEGME